MGFKEELQKLSIQINERRLHITNEETTKTALIMPLLQVLGYDIFNPLEVKPEYIADFGLKKGEKVDYALFKDNNPTAFIEAKSVNEKLQNHDAQLSRYFNAVPTVKLGIISNGVEYRFFTDLQTDNVMDATPFLIVDITNLKEQDFDTLSQFKKDTFNKENLFKFAEELVYTSALNDNLKKLFKNPSDEFVRFLIKDLSDVRVTSNVIERFRPIVKKAISNAVLDIVSTGLIQQEMSLKEEEKSQEEKNAKEIESEDIEDVNKKEHSTTEEELKSFDIIKSILQNNGRNTKDLIYKDTKNYFSINNKNTYGWFLRIILDTPNKNILTKLDFQKLQPLTSGLKTEQGPNWMGGSRVYISSIEDIKKLDKAIVTCFDEVLREQGN